MIDIVQFNVDNNLLVYVLFLKETRRHNVFGHKTLGVSVVWISLAQNKKHYQIKRKWKHEERGLSTSVVWCSDVVLTWLGKSFEAQTHTETHTCICCINIFIGAHWVSTKHTTLWFYANAMWGIVCHFTECLTLFALVSHFVTQCSVSA